LASGARLYIAGLAIGTIAGIDLYTAILIVSAAGLLYCFCGGLRAVVWTDVLQAVIFLGSGLFSIRTVLAASGGGAAAIATLEHADKLRLIHGDMNIFSAEFWANPYTLVGAIIGGCTLGLATHGTDQDMVQRMLACRSSRHGRLSLLLSALLEIPTAAIYVLLGSFLWVYYRQPGTEPPPASSSVYPHFIATVAPHGLRGLFLAGIVAAAMSSLDSVLNALASVSISDMYLPLTRRKRQAGAESSSENDDKAIALSKLHTLFWAAVLTLTALGLGYHHQQFLAHTAGDAGNHATELLTLALGVMSFVYGPILGIFLLGLFTRRGSDRSILLGVFAGLLVTTIVQLGNLPALGWTWQILLGTLSTLIIAGCERTPGNNAHTPTKTGP
jgi:Na+/proline symporter